MKFSFVMWKTFAITREFLLQYVDGFYLNYIFSLLFYIKLSLTKSFHSGNSWILLKVFKQCGIIEYVVEHNIREFESFLIFQQ